ncbi:hypothetical protein N7526_000083 [Penicillium atrosanguineum]|nr:hypothetical protein N7526_000083 [Penicillium atrosanguineum]
MSGFSLKGGWHPKGKDGKKESWRGDFKGIDQVAGWMGKSKEASEDQSEHVSQPLSALKDPSAFGPPPKHINYHGAGALPNETTPDRRGMGAPLSQEQINYQNYQQQQAIQAEEEAAQKPAPPPVPYRVNTTGLSTSNLPPPPGAPGASTGSSTKRLACDEYSPPPYSASTPPASQGYVNQEATSRLSNAGVSVPALGIGETNRPSSQNSSSYTETAKGKMNDLQSRFSQMRTNSGSSSPAPAQTDRFPRTNTNPDASLPPAPGFRERHADKIDMGKEKLGGVTSRFNTFVEDRKFSSNANKRIPRPPSDYVSPSPVAVGVVRSAAPVARAAPVASAAPVPPVAPVPSRTPDVQAQAQRKRPPPPPPKKAEFRAPAANTSPVSSASPPPPVPMNTKPR